MIAGPFLIVLFHGSNAASESNLKAAREGRIEIKTRKKVGGSGNNRIHH